MAFKPPQSCASDPLLGTFWPQLGIWGLKAWWAVVLGFAGETDMGASPWGCGGAWLPLPWGRDSFWQRRGCPMGQCHTCPRILWKARTGTQSPSQHQGTLRAHQGHSWRFQQRYKICQSLISKRCYLWHGISQGEHGKQTQPHSLGVVLFCFVSQSLLRSCSQAVFRRSEQIQHFLARRDAEEKQLHLGRHWC